MSRSIPVTAGTPSNDFASWCSRIAPPVTGGRSRSRRSGGHRLSKPGEVRGEPVDIGLVVLNGQQPLLHLAPRRQEHTAIVLHQPMQVAQSIVDLKEIAEIVNRLAVERHTALGS